MERIFDYSAANHVQPGTYCRRMVDRGRPVCQDCLFGGQGQVVQGRGQGDQGHDRGPAAKAQGDYPEKEQGVQRIVTKMDDVFLVSTASWS
jgi:hypothetical protein